jgi:hypothetical protein
MLEPISSLEIITLPLEIMSLFLMKMDPINSILVTGSMLPDDNGTILTSDARFKQDVNTISNSTDIISRLNPVSYTWNLLGQQHGGKAGVQEY